MRSLLGAIAFGMALVASQALAAPPNIVFVVSDDQRADTIQSLGNPRIQTPTLDALVRRGTSFTRAVATYPICHVSRAEMLTGCPAREAYPKYPNPPINSKLQTLPRAFAEAGYVVCYTGKWHTDGTPQRHGYTTTSGLYSSGGGKGQRLTHQTDHAGRLVTGYTGWTFKTASGTAEPDKGIGLTSATDRHIADGAIRFLERQERGKPFLLHINFTSPHDPRIWPEGERHYRAADMKLPDNFAPKHPFDHGNIDGRDEKLLPRPLQQADVQAELACYYAMITEMDRQLGRVIQTLADTGHMSNAIIIFTSDQGLALGSHGLLGKQNLYEHTVTVPLIIAGPGMPENQRSSAQCRLYDLFPTLCELAALPIPSTVQGKSLLPLLKDNIKELHRLIIAHFTDTQTMVRENRFKLIHYWKQNRSQLFDLHTDPQELSDLGESPAHRDLFTRLWASLPKH